MKNEPVWARLLMIMYQGEPPGIEPDSVLNDEQQTLWPEEDFYMETKLTKRQARNASAKLVQWGLIEEYDDRMYQLTERGFNVAHSKRTSDQERRMSEAIAGFTLFLVLVNVAAQFNPPIQWYLMGALVLGTGIYAYSMGFLSYSLK